MKKFTFILPAMLICFVTTWAQKIKYEKSFDEAKRLSREQNKPLAILITIQPPAQATNFTAGLSNWEVVAKFNANFVNYKINREDTVSRLITSQYRIYRFPSFIFLDSKGGLMFREVAMLSNPQKLLITADQALDAGKEKSMTDFDNEYGSGVYNAAFLKEYINKRRRAGITDNAALVEKYVDFLSISDLNDYNQVLFILQAGPPADSRTYKLANTNRRIIDSIYKTELYDVRTAINNVIISNTMASAISNKSISTALAAANFTRTTWGKDYREAQKNYTLKMLQYYGAIKDTTNYLQQAAHFYDEYYMNISADSVKKRDAKNLERAKSNARERAMLNIPEGGALQSFSYTYASRYFATELNNAAWSLYKTGTKNGTYLTKAMLWSKRAIELNPVAAYYDTFAHLLYRLELYAEAESSQQKAVEMAKAENRNVKQLQEEFIKIKNKTL
ncbi:MAG: hypothetical protein H7Z13_14110 [Ferruginibacter sp.]|nr:hypothetical protein [Ferruginibacter sp.]